MILDDFNFQKLITSESFYWFSAFMGTGMFAIQLCLNLMGLVDYEDVDFGELADAGKFKWLSWQAFTGFLMMFGWSGLTCRKEFDLGEVSTLVIALLCGVIVIFVTGYILKSARKLHSFGMVFKIEDTLGQEAVVYQRIPHDGVGKISVCVQNFSREIDARSSNLKEIPSFARVRIIKSADDKTVIVEAV